MRWPQLALAAATLTTLLGLGELATRVVCANFPVYDLEMHNYALQLKRRSAAPGLSHEHVPRGRARLMGVEVRLNSLGLRGPEVPARKPKGAVRILVLGDSIALGWGVEEGATFPACWSAG